MQHVTVEFSGEMHYFSESRRSHGAHKCDSAIPSQSCRPPACLLLGLISQSREAAVSEPTRQDVILLRLVINLFCLPNTVSVPEEHPDVPVGVQRRVWHEEKRAV